MTAKGPATLTKIEEIEASKNTGELTVVVEALKRLKAPCSLTIYTDSEYVAAGLEQDWIGEWIRNGWMTAKGKEVANKDLWEELVSKIGENVIFRVAEGHPYRAWMEMELKKGGKDIV